jgi:hypothetical protein
VNHYDLVRESGWLIRSLQTCYKGYDSINLVIVNIIRIFTLKIIVINCVVVLPRPSFLADNLVTFPTPWCRVACKSLKSKELLDVR